MPVRVLWKVIVLVGVLTAVSLVSYEEIVRQWRVYRYRARQKQVQHLRDVIGHYQWELEQNPDVLEVRMRDGQIQIVTDNSARVPRTLKDLPVQHLPAPPYPAPLLGVFVQRPDPTRIEVWDHLPQTTVCPEGYRDRWRYRVHYCVPLPPPVAGMPFKDAAAIFWRHVEELRALPGVSPAEVGLDEDGIVVVTDHPELAPREVEGLPVKTLPPPSIRPT